VASDLQVLGEVDLDEKPASTSPQGLQILGEEDLSPPKLRPEDQAQIDRAIRSVPLPKPDYMQTEQTLRSPIAQPPTPFLLKLFNSKKINARPQELRRHQC